MQVVRLMIGALASLVAGVVVAWITSTADKAIWLCGLLLLLLNLPVHLSDPVWSDYPLWYHLIYLAYIAPLTILGGKLANKSAMKGS
jgi:hypothetical protein